MNIKSFSIRSLDSLISHSVGTKISLPKVLGKMTFLFHVGGNMLVPSRGNDFELGVRFYVDCFIEFY